MPFTTPNSFTNATAITASDIRENNEALRLYLNSAIDGADIDNGIVTEQEILRGEYAGVVKEHQFISGDILLQRKDTQAFNRSYFTGQMKQIEDYTTLTHYMPIPNTGKRLVIEREAKIHIHGYYVFVVGANALNENTTGTDHVIYTVLDTNINSSYGLCFSMEAAASANSGAVIGTTLNNRRTYPITYTGTISEGIHDLYLAVDCQTDMGYVSAVNLYVEIFYL